MGYCIREEEKQFLPYFKQKLIEYVSSIPEGGKPCKINWQSDFLEQIIFKIEIDQNGYYRKTFDIPEEIAKKLDLSNVSFDNFDLHSVGDLSEFHGVKLDPRRVYYRDLSGCNFEGITFIGPFNGCSIINSSFRGSVGAKINPQVLGIKSLGGCDLCDVAFTGPFHTVSVIGCSFAGSKGAIINPQTVYAKTLSNSIYRDVTFLGYFDGATIKNASFLGSKDARINPQTINGKDLTNCDLGNVTFVGIFDGAYINYSNFRGSVGAVIDPQTVANRNLSGDLHKKTNFRDVTFVGQFFDCDICNTCFEGSKGANIDVRNLKDGLAIGIDFTGTTFCNVDGAYTNGSTYAGIDFDRYVEAVRHNYVSGKTKVLEKAVRRSSRRYF